MGSKRSNSLQTASNPLPSSSVKAAGILESTSKTAITTLGSMSFLAPHTGTTISDWVLPRTQVCMYSRFWEGLKIQPDVDARKQAHWQSTLWYSIDEWTAGLTRKRKQYDRGACARLGQSAAQQIACVKIQGQSHALQEHHKSVNSKKISCP